MKEQPITRQEAAEWGILDLIPFKVDGKWVTVYNEPFDPSKSTASQWENEFGSRGIGGIGNQRNGPLPTPAQVTSLPSTSTPINGSNSTNKWTPLMNKRLQELIKEQSMPMNSSNSSNTAKKWDPAMEKRLQELLNEEPPILPGEEKEMKGLRELTEQIEVKKKEIETENQLSKTSEEKIKAYELKERARKKAPELESWREQRKIEEAHRRTRAEADALKMEYDAEKFPFKLSRDRKKNKRALECVKKEMAYVAADILQSAKRPRRGLLTSEEMEQILTVEQEVEVQYFQSKEGTSEADQDEGTSSGKFGASVEDLEHNPEGAPDQQDSCYQDQYMGIYEMDQGKDFYFECKYLDQGAKMNQEIQSLVKDMVEFLDLETLVDSLTDQMQNLKIEDISEVSQLVSNDQVQNLKLEDTLETSNYDDMSPEGPDDVDPDAVNLEDLDVDVDQESHIEVDDSRVRILDQESYEEDLQEEEEYYEKAYEEVEEEEYVRSIRTLRDLGIETELKKVKARKEEKIEKVVKESEANAQKSEAQGSFSNAMKSLEKSIDVEQAVQETINVMLLVLENQDPQPVFFTDYYLQILPGTSVLDKDPRLRALINAQMELEEEVPMNPDEIDIDQSEMDEEDEIRVFEKTEYVNRLLEEEDYFEALFKETKSWELQQYVWDLLEDLSQGSEDLESEQDSFVAQESLSEVQNPIESKLKAQGSSPNTLDDMKSNEDTVAVDQKVRATIDGILDQLDQIEEPGVQEFSQYPQHLETLVKDQSMTSDDRKIQDPAKNTKNLGPASGLPNNQAQDNGKKEVQESKNKVLEQTSINPPEPKQDALNHKDEDAEPKTIKNPTKTKQQVPAPATNLPTSSNPNADDDEEIKVIAVIKAPIVKNYSIPSTLVPVMENIDKVLRKRMAETGSIF